MCERAVAGGHSAGELRGPAASALQPVHLLQPAGPLRAHSTLGLESSRSVTVDVLRPACTPSSFSPSA